MERRLTKLKLTSVSKSALAAMLVSGVLVTTPMLASADNSSGESDVTIQTTKGKAKLNDDLKVSVKNNDDGTKTISITVPNADITKDGSQSLNKASFNVKTDSDTDNDSQTNVSSGDVKQTSDLNNAKFKIDLNKSALENDQLMNDNLTITVTDHDGHTLGTISNVTANELLKAAESQNSATNSSTHNQSSSSIVDSSSTNTTKSSEVVINSDDTSPNTSSTKSDSDTAISPISSSSKAADTNNDNATAPSSSVPEGTNASSPASNKDNTNNQTANQSSNNQNTGSGNGNQAQTGNNSQSGQSNPQSGQGQAADQGNGQNGDNSELPQTSNGGTYQSSFGILGLVTAILTSLGLKKAKHNN